MEIFITSCWELGPFYETCPETEHFKAWNSFVVFVLKSLSNILKHVNEVYPQRRAYADI